MRAGIHAIHCRRPERHAVGALLRATAWLVVSASSALAADSPTPPTRESIDTGPTVAIIDVTVIDVERGRRLGHRTVLVANGLVAAIGARGAVAVPAGATRVDGRGRFLVPGLVDMHVHLFNNASKRPPNDWAFPLWVANGVTGVREMHTAVDDLPQVGRWRDAVAHGALIAPRVLAAGVAARGTSAADAARAVDAAADAGADFIKVFSEVPRAHWRAILAAAQARGLAVDGHVPAGVRLLDAATAGQRTAEHLMQAFEACSSIEASALSARDAHDGDAAVAQRDTKELDVLAAFDRRACRRVARALATRRTALVPTLVLDAIDPARARSDYRADPRWALLRADERARWERNLAAIADDSSGLVERRRAVGCRIVRTMHRAGVRVLAGTDSPMPLGYPGSALHEELQRLVDCGLTPSAALRAATLDAMDTLGLTASGGSVTVGKRADMVLLDADPLRRIDNVRRVHAVVLAGRLLTRAMLDDPAMRGQSHSPTASQFGVRVIRRRPRNSGSESFADGLAMIATGSIE